MIDGGKGEDEAGEDRRAEAFWTEGEREEEGGRGEETVSESVGVGVEVGEADSLASRLRGGGEMCRTCVGVCDEAVDSGDEDARDDGDDEDARDEDDKDEDGEDADTEDVDEEDEGREDDESAVEVDD